MKIGCLDVDSLKTTLILYKSPMIASQNKYPLLLLLQLSVIQKKTWVYGCIEGSTCYDLSTNYTYVISNQSYH